MRSTENRDLVGLDVHEFGPVSLTEDIENRPVLNEKKIAIEHHHKFLFWYWLLHIEFNNVINKRYFILYFAYLIFARLAGCAFSISSNRTINWFISAIHIILKVVVACD